MSHIFSTAVRAEHILGNQRTHLNLNADELFELIDEYKLGYLSPHMLSKYMQKTCFYKIQDQEISHLLDRYDRHNNYRIKREEFAS